MEDEPHVSEAKITLNTRIARRLILAVLPNPIESWQHFPEADIAEFTGPRANDPARLDALRKKIQEIRTQKSTAPFSNG